MSISLSSSSSQDLLRQLLQQQAAAQASATSALAGAGQTSPGVATDTALSAGVPAAPPPPKPDGAADQRFGPETLGALISSQGAATSASQAASSLVSASDTDGDGELSTDEITAALTQAGDTVDGSTISSAVKALDTDGDGSLSTSEIASGLQQAHGARHHHHGGHHAPQAASASTSTSALPGAAAGDGDPLLDAIAPEAATSASASTGGAASLQSAFSALDSGDGSLNLGELTSAIQAFIAQQGASQGVATAQGAGVSLAA